MPDGTASITLDDLEVTASAPAIPATTSDTLTIVVRGKEWSGWKRVAVARQLEGIPATFDLMGTEKYPRTGEIDIRPGDPCQVKIGGELVITGYIDRYAASISPREHNVRVTGRSKSSDLVDCAAFFGSQEQERYFSPGGTTLSIAQQLAEPYGIKVQSRSGEGVHIIRFAINLGETAWEIIDRITKYSALLAYDMPDGSLMLSTAGTEKMGSGFRQGVNVEQAEVNFTMDQRYSIYKGYLLSTAVLSQDTAQGGGGQVPRAEARDTAVPRFRKRIIISEQTQLGKPIIDKRVIWEKNRRAGRSQAVTISVDSWRDAAGKLWAPNCLAPISLPALKLPNEDWCIGSVTYIRDENGQHAAIQLMPPDAFQPEPAPDRSLPSLDAMGKAPNNPTARTEDSYDPLTGNPTTAPNNPTTTSSSFDPLTGNPK